MLLQESGQPTPFFGSNAKDVTNTRVNTANTFMNFMSLDISNKLNIFPKKIIQYKKTPNNIIINTNWYRVLNLNI
jgi:hypothetical protein